MHFLGFINTVSECLIGYVIFGGHSTHGETIIKLNIFLGLIDILLASSVGIYGRVQRVLIKLLTRPIIDAFCLLSRLVGRCLGRSVFVFVGRHGRSS